MNHPSSHYREKYSQGVIRRDHTLELYGQFLQNLGEHQTLEQLVHRVLRRKESCRVIDIGCGEGNALKKLCELFGERVHTIGVDLVSPVSLKGIDEFLEGDVHTLTLPGECDILISFRSLHEMGGFETLLPALAATLAKGGRGYCWIRMREATDGTPAFVGEMDEKEERSLFSMVHKSPLNGVQLLLQPIPVPIPVKHEDAERETMMGGYVLLLHKPL